ncbi:MAG: HipA domain-containing protein, partial [Actinomycetales bacterium]|nr:HipA domain-containing protein [Actinomycetales bacterium]
MTTSLDAWLYGTHVATFTPGAREDAVEITWTDAAQARWGVNARVLSHLLPIPRPGQRSHPARARVWLEGLLPEGSARTHLAMDAGVNPDDTLAFLAHYGRDTAGAVILVPAGAPEPDKVGSTEPVTETQIGAMLRRAEKRAGPGGNTRDSLTSLAGLEPKIALARSADGTWRRCLDGAASTHILKVSRPASSASHDVIDTEAAALDLARRVGLTTISAEIATFDGVRCIVVSRYDRHIHPGGRVERTHQEDAAQALGLDTRDAERKFQHGKALPCLAAIADVIRTGGAEPDQLLALTTFNLAVGNTDAHAKNISFMRPPDGTASLAPAYDVAMHMHSDASSGIFAMDVAGERRMAQLTATHLINEGVSWGLPRSRATRAVHSTLADLAGALNEAERDAHAGVSHAAWSTVEARTGDLLKQAGSLAGPARRSGVRAADSPQGRVPKGT